MIITDIQAICLRLPEVHERTDSSQEACLVKITTDSGIVGWGEVDSSPQVTKAIIEAPYSHKLAAGLKSILVGEDPLDINRLWNKMYEETLYIGRSGAVIHAMAGIDLALWDLKGKALDQPIHKLIGGGYRDKLRVYASHLFEFTPEATAEKAMSAVDSGFTAVKFGWEPFGETLKTDVRYLEAIRNAVGEDVDLLLDAGLAWDAKTTIQRCREFEQFNLELLEEPLHPDDLRGYATVATSVDQKIAAGEEESTVAGYLRLMDEGKIDVVQIDLTRCGLTQALVVAELAFQRGLPCINHNFTTDINTAASLHFLSSIPNAYIMEYCAESSEISNNLVKEPLVLVDGHMSVPDSPGLGVEPNLEAMNRYIV